jgi:hypothetical protein
MCYVKLPVMVKDSVLLALSRMVLHDITTAFDARAGLPRRLRTPFLCLMECFDAYGMHMRNGAWERARASRVCLAPVIRTAWDRLAEHDADGVFEVVGNTFTKVWFGQPHGAHASHWLDQLPAGTLDELQAGELILNVAASAVRARLAPHHLFEGAPPEQGTGFTPRRMMRAEPRTRLAITLPDKTEVSP